MSPWVTMRYFIKEQDISICARKVKVFSTNLDNHLTQNCGISHTFFGMHGTILIDIKQNYLIF